MRPAAEFFQSSGLSLTDAGSLPLSLRSRVLWCKCYDICVWRIHRVPLSVRKDEISAYFPEILCKAKKRPRVQKSNLDRSRSLLRDQVLEIRGLNAKFLETFPLQPVELAEALSRGLIQQSSPDSAARMLAV